MSLRSLRRKREGTVVFYFRGRSRHVIIWTAPREELILFNKASTQQDTTLNPVTPKTANTEHIILERERAIGSTTPTCQNV